MEVLGTVLNLPMQLASGALNNGMILELQKSTAKVPWREMANAVNCHEGSLRLYASNVKKKYQSLNRHISREGMREELEQFLTKTFIPPPQKTSQKTTPSQVKSAPCNSCAMSISAYEDLLEQKDAKFRKMESSYQEQVNTLQKKLSQSKKRRIEKTQILERKLKSLYDEIGCSPKKVRKRVLDLKRSRKKWRNKWKALSKKCEQLEARHMRRRKTERNRKLQLERMLRKSKSQTKPVERKAKTMTPDISEYVYELERENETT